jgi:hypothetical protein
MKQAKPLFANIMLLLLSVSHPDRCKDDVITCNCELFQDICVTLDKMRSKMRINNGLPTQEDFMILQCALYNLNYAWTQAGISYTPRFMGCYAIHSTNAETKWILRLTGG